MTCTGCLILSSCNQPPTPNTDKPSSPASTTNASATPSSPPPKSVTTNTEQLGADPLQLLQSDQIKTELSLTDDQIAQIKQVQSDLRTRLTKEYDAIKALPKEKQIDEVEKKIEPLNKESRAKMDKILKPEQAKRAKEIILQIYGFGVLTRNDFTTELKITDAQKKKFNNISEQMVAKLKSTVEIPTGDAAQQAKSISNNRKRMANIVKESDKQVNAVLTAEQQKTLEALKGKTFAYVKPTPPSAAQ
jgi:Spy/CpxP family protein refolding chaperone